MKRVLWTICIRFLDLRSWMVSEAPWQKYFLVGFHNDCYHLIVIMVGTNTFSSILPHKLLLPVAEVLPATSSVVFPVFSTIAMWKNSSLYLWITIRNYDFQESMERLNVKYVNNKVKKIKIFFPLSYPVRIQTSYLWVLFRIQLIEVPSTFHTYKYIPYIKIWTFLFVCF